MTAKDWALVRVAAGFTVIGGACAFLALAAVIGPVALILIGLALAAVAVVTVIWLAAWLVRLCLDRREWYC
jgi:hypothetical protein